MSEKKRTFPGGLTTYWPADMPDEEVDRRAVEDFQQSIDYSTGAPEWLRGRVGAAPTPEDRLSTLRKFVPQSWSYGEDNFLFVNPETQKLTLYNPQGLDMGDVASEGRTIYSIGGGIMGGIAGAALGGPPGAIIGGALGATGLGEAHDVAQRLMGTVDTRSIGRRLGETGAEVLMNIGGEGVGRGIEAGVKALFRGTGDKAKEAAQRLAAFESVGVDVPLGDVSRKTWTQWTQKAASTMVGGSRITEMAEKATKKLENIFEGAARLSGTVRAHTPQEGGQALQKAALLNKADFEVAAARKYNTSLHGLRDIPVNPSETVLVLDDIFGRTVAQLERTGKKELASDIGQLYLDLADAVKSGALPDLSVIRRQRTKLGAQLQRPELINDAQFGEIETVYKALSNDIRASLPPDRVAAFDEANRFYHEGIAHTRDVLNKLAKEGVSPETAFAWAISGAGVKKGGGSRLAAVRQGMPAADWDVFVSSILGQMGRTKSGFSGPKFVSDYAEIAPEAKHILFNTSPTYRNLRPELERAVKVMRMIDEGKAMRNTSNTAPMMYWMRILAGGGLFGSLVSGGNIESAALAAAVSPILPYTASRLWTSPGVVRWMVAPVHKNGVAAHIGRLSAIAAREPMMEGPIRELLDAFTLTSPPEQDGPIDQSKVETKSK